MRTGLLACALLGVVLVACGSRSDLLGSPGGTNDAGIAADGTATTMQDGSFLPPDPAATLDAGATCEAGSMVDEAGATACYVAPWIIGTECDVATPPMNGGCGASEYQVACGASANFAPRAAAGCVSMFGHGGTDYCCPCLRSDAAALCANIDFSTYDRSCCSDSDCVIFPGYDGLLCSGDCACAPLSRHELQLRGLCGDSSGLPAGRLHPGAPREPLSGPAVRR
jgi:hypothetical protein